MFILPGLLAIARGAPDFALRRLCRAAAIVLVLLMWEECFRLGLGIIFAHLEVPLFAGDLSILVVWLASGLTPLVAVNVRSYAPPVPVAGVPLSTPVAALKESPFGSAPVSPKMGAGTPAAVTASIVRGLSARFEVGAFTYSASAPMLPAVEVTFKVVARTPPAMEVLVIES